MRYEIILRETREGGGAEVTIQFKTYINNPTCIISYHIIYIYHNIITRTYCTPPYDKIKKEKWVSVSHSCPPAVMRDLMILFMTGIIYASSNEWMMTFSFGKLVYGYSISFSFPSQVDYSSY